MKSARRRALRHPPSSNTRYLEKLYNVEGLDHNVLEPVLIPVMADMEIQKKLRSGRLKLQLILNKSIKVNGD